MQGLMKFRMRTNDVVHVTQEKYGITGLQCIPLFNIWQMQLKFTIQYNVKTRTRKTGGRCFPGATILPYMKQGGLQL